MPKACTDDLELLAAAYQVANKNPLGSGAGYGSSFPLNRKRTTELFRFRHTQLEFGICPMSRGKTEKVVANALGRYCRYHWPTGHGLLFVYQPEFRFHFLSR